jgi:hypothetical protein
LRFINEGCVLNNKAPTIMRKILAIALLRFVGGRSARSPRS